MTLAWDGTFLQAQAALLATMQRRDTEGDAAVLSDVLHMAVARAELDAAVEELLEGCDALLKGAVVHAPTLRKHVKRVRELMKKAGV